MTTVLKLMVELLEVTGKVEVKELVELERFRFFSRLDFSFLIVLQLSLSKCSKKKKKKKQCTFL